MEIDSFLTFVEDKNKAGDENKENANSFSHKVYRECELFSSLPVDAAYAAGNHIAEHPQEVAYSAAVGLVAGAALASMAKNPYVLGRNAAPYLRTAVEGGAFLSGCTAGVDWSRRLGEPMVMAWQGTPLSEAKAVLANNVGSGVVDYGVGMAAALPGAALGWKLTPTWENKAPWFDPKPSLKMSEPARTVQDESKFVTKAESDIKPDVKALYEGSFPVEELQPTAEVMDLVSRGRILVHTTRDTEGALQAFSFTSKHDETAMKFLNLDFIATQSAERSHGIGSLHARRLNELVRASEPEVVGMTIEMESPFKGVQNLSAEEVATRLRRTKFYDRLDAPNTNIEFNILDFNDPTYRGPAEWRAWVYKPEKFNAVTTARTMHVDEGGYGVSRYAKSVREFELANNYWEPTMLGVKDSAVYAGATAIGLKSTAGALYNITRGSKESLIAK